LTDESHLHIKIMLRTLLTAKVPYMKTASKINREWHEQHRMPDHATLDQRIAWHIEHAKNCQCRPIPGNIMEEIKKRKG